MPQANSVGKTRYKAFSKNRMGMYGFGIFCLWPAELTQKRWESGTLREVSCCWKAPGVRTTGVNADRSQDELKAREMAQGPRVLSTQA